MKIRTLSESENKLAIYTTLLAVVGMALVLLSTRWGAGIGGDATTYLFSARNLLDGKGLGLVGPQGEFSFLALFPPGFPLTLSAIGLFGLDLAVAVRWLNLLLFGLLINLSAWTVFRASGSLLAGLLAAALVAFSPLLSPIYSTAVSEPLALFLGFASLSALLEYLRTPAQRYKLFLSAGLAAYAFLVRYASAGFIGAAILALLLFSSLPARKRWADAALYAILTALPMGIWLGVDYLNTAAISSRELESSVALAARALDFWPQLGDVLLSWLIPASWMEAPFYPAVINQLLPFVLVGGTLLWAGAVLARPLRHWTPASGLPAPIRLMALLLIFSAVYLGVIFVVYVFTQPVISINNRMLAPLHVAWLWLLPLLAQASWSRLPRQRALQVGLTLALIGLVGWSGLRAVRITADSYARGLDYNTDTWRNSELIQAVRELPEDTLLVTNETAGLLYSTGRAAYPLEEPVRGQPQEGFPRYGEGDLTDDLGQQLFRQGDAVLVLFFTAYDQFEPLYGEQAPQRVDALFGGLETLHLSRMGMIVRYPR